jgi:hypothetical protein
MTGTWAERRDGDRNMSQLSSPDVSEMVSVAGLDPGCRHSSWMLPSAALYWTSECGVEIGEWKDHHYTEQ